MWVNIYLQRKKFNWKTYQGYWCKEHKEYNSEDVKDWDSMKYIWDKEFARADIDWEYLEWDEYNSCRPKDFKQARDWLKDKEEHIQDRFNFALDEMEKDKDVYIDFSW